MLTISNVEITDTNLRSRETKIHHELDKNLCIMFNSQVKTVAEFIPKKGNSYKMLALSLNNCIRSTISSADTKKVLNCYIHGNEQQDIFRTERCLDKLKKLSETMQKITSPKPVDASKKP